MQRRKPVLSNWRSKFQHVSSTLFKHLHVRGHGVALVPLDGHYQCWNVHMLPPRQLLLQGRLRTFQQDDATTAYCSYSNSRPLQEKSSCSVTDSNWKHLRVIKRKVQQRRFRTAEQLESYMEQERADISLPKRQRLVSSASRRLQAVVKRSGKHGPLSELFWRCAAGIILKMTFSLVKIVHFVTLNIWYASFPSNVNKTQVYEI